MTFATFETILRGAPSALMGRVEARGTVPTSPRAHGRFHLATRLRPWSKRTKRRETGYGDGDRGRSEEHTSELQSLMRISYAVFCLTITQEKKQIYILLYHQTNNKRLVKSH